LHLFQVLDTDHYARYNGLSSNGALTAEKHFVTIGAAEKVAGIHCLEIPSFFHSDLMKKIMGFAIYQHYVYDNIRIHNLNEIFSIPKLSSSKESDTDFFVEVIVPAYGAVTSVSKCLHSISAAKTEVNYSVCVIDDATPDSSESKEIESLCKEFGFEYVRNKLNLGFVKTANKGLRRSGGNSLLLNSDTIVFDGWLEAFESVIASDIGTVTCLSNNATIYSIPMDAQSEVDEIQYSRELAHTLKLLDSSPIEIPTAHGFCMLITKQAKEIVGFFDEENFGQGYGEENDYSLRVSKYGLKNILTPKTLVFHEGSASFGSSVTARQMEAGKTLVAMWPEYPEVVSSFLAKNQIMEFIAKARLATLKISHKPTVVHFGHNLGGGVDVAIKGEIFNRDKNLANAIWVKPSRGEMQYSLRVYDLGGESLEFEVWNVHPKNLAAHLNQLNVEQVVVHHQLGYEELPEILDSLTAPYSFRIHDYNALCPFNNFVTVSGDYCGEPSDLICNKCISDRSPEFLDIQTWRISKTRILLGANEITAPSVDTKNRFDKYLKDIQITIKPNNRPVALESNADSRIALAMLGVLNVSKGLLNAIQVMHAIKSHFKFILVGSVPGDLISEEVASLLDDGTFQILGPYSDDQQAIRILEMVKPKALFFPGRIPETYSFTLDVATKIELPIFAYDIGAIPERALGSSLIELPLTASPGDVANSFRNYFGV
jgi:GT2 family glycosyltransferase